jgi:hypothetical protein
MCKHSEPNSEGVQSFRPGGTLAMGVARENDRLKDAGCRFEAIPGLGLAEPIPLIHPQCSVPPLWCPAPRTWETRRVCQHIGSITAADQHPACCRSSLSASNRAATFIAYSCWASPEIVDRRLEVMKVSWRSSDWSTHGKHDGIDSIPPFSELIIFYCFTA